MQRRQTIAAGAAANVARSGSQMVLLTLAAGQFLMTLDSSVMNVSIATVAKSRWETPHEESQYGRGEADR